MKTYKVTITETLQMEVEVDALTRREAEEMVEQNWNSSEYILDATHFKGVSFRAERPERERGYDR